ncbi:Capsule assembly protein Wzi [Saccharicrinis carchari]|uniref:Capsule assembly protein Wzi n=1 Tax=Saccharicrinis carchari TaxID=1168039 RepID=A0A521C0R1_SACCC|nr:hypothetical protein [Saccharicrinis carchari]SMO53027.1 Capsule assembly protein Wzi [Saccharicrinis carchari]
MILKKQLLPPLHIMLFALLTMGSIHAQLVPYHIDNEVVYDFIDELANKGVINLNSTVKPYSRMQIAHFLAQAQKSRVLTSRQSQELNFYLKDFNKELHGNKDFRKRFDIFYHADSTFKFSGNIILGGRAYLNSNGFEQHRWNGAQFFATMGNKLAFYGSLRDNYESIPLANPEKLSQHRGAVYKKGENNKDYSETRGGIVYSWQTGSIGLVKDHFTWGNNNNGAHIFAGNTPSFAHIKFSLKPVKWLEFNYLHGWLASEVEDSSASYNLHNDTRRVFTNKYIAANLISVQPWEKLYFSFGNSIIYSDGNINAAYLIPFLFYKSVDHSYNGSRNSAGHNTQMFFDLSSRQINNTHLYTGLFIDEISIANMLNEDKHSNFISLKIGARVTDILPNLSAGVEYTHTKPFAYTHFIPSLTFQSNKYTLGHYLKDNADELFLMARYKPIRGLDIELSYIHCRKGEDHQKILEESGAIENLWGDGRTGYAFIQNLRYKKNALKLKAQYQFINDAYIYTEIEGYKLSGPDAMIYTAAPYYGDNKMIVLGLNFGF